MNDTQRLDWLEKQGDKSNWIARQSTAGRGFRLHNVTGMDYTGHKTIREAIDVAIAERAQVERALAKIIKRNHAKPARKNGAT